MQAPSTLPHALPHAELPHPDVLMPLPIAKLNSKYTELSSSEVDKIELRAVRDVWRNYPTLRRECKMSILAVMFGEKAFFGDAIFIS